MDWSWSIEAVETIDEAGLQDVVKVVHARLTGVRDGKSAYADIKIQLPELLHPALFVPFEELTTKTVSRWTEAALAPQDGLKAMVENVLAQLDTTPVLRVRRLPV